jgi:hypothetical protein
VKNSQINAHFPSHPIQTPLSWHPQIDDQINETDSSQERGGVKEEGKERERESERFKIQTKNQPEQVAAAHKTP